MKHAHCAGRDGRCALIAATAAAIDDGDTEVRISDGECRSQRHANAMRGISAHSNGFHTCRAIHMLQMLLGSVDVPGGFRHKPPFPKPCPPGPKPAGQETAPGQTLGGMPLGFPQGPEDLLVDEGRWSETDR